MCAVYPSSHFCYVNNTFHFLSTIMVDRKDHSNLPSDLFVVAAVKCFVCWEPFAAGKLFHPHLGMAR